MKDKVVIKRENYRQIMLKRAIISCWAILIVCFIIKLFGGNFFAIICKNEKFIKVCDYIDNSIIFDIIQFITFTSTSYLILLSIEPNATRKSKIIYLVLIAVCFIYKMLVKYNIISINIGLQNILEFAMLYISCFICENKDTKLKLRIIKPIIFIALLFVFTLISVITKNIGIKESLDSSFLNGFIFMIDYYIMIVLTYLYRKRRI